MVSYALGTILAQKQSVSLQEIQKETGSDALIDRADGDDFGLWHILLANILLIF